MYYYHVWVRSNRYHGKEALTYNAEVRLESGALVEVELQKERVMGLVVGTTSKPRFATKPLLHIYDAPPLPSHLLQTAVWLQSYYPAPLGVVTQQIVPGHYSQRQMQHEPLKNAPEPVTDALPALNEEQRAALTALQAPGTHVLHGKTGTGKTRLYIELALQAIASGKSAIVLTPEISLTSQLAANFSAVFGERVLVLHSGQAPAERRQLWLQILTAREPLVVIGPRSALFTPVRRLGLVVLDESHESAYKQEQAPNYHASRVAGYMARLTGARLVLGSATPLVTDYYLAEQKGSPIIVLQHLARGETVATKTHIIDMKDRDQFSRSHFISQPLIAAVQAALQRSEQSLLYLNRRGTARIVLCENCGWQASCPHCDTPLTYHGDTHTLRCHSCDCHDRAPASCPECGHPSIIYKTAGTKAIVEEVTRLFPQARIARFDTDNVKAERFEQHYEAVANGDVDILVGTQLLAKGLDLPRLSTLGVLLADTSLYLPDFSAQERTYQLLNQVLGRVGRGHVAGHAFIQTYNPEHPLFAQAIAGDYEAFYKAELANRKQFGFPPFYFMLKLTCRRASLRAAEKAATDFKQQLLADYPRVKVEGPAPAFYEKFQGKHQWQLILKASERSELVKIIGTLPANWSYDIDPIDLL